MLPDSWSTIVLLRTGLRYFCTKPVTQAACDWVGRCIASSDQTRNPLLCAPMMTPCNVPCTTGVRRTMMDARTLLPKLYTSTTRAEPRTKTPRRGQHAPPDASGPVAASVRRLHLHRAAAAAALVVREGEGKKRRRTPRVPSRGSSPTLVQQNKPALPVARER